jgi:hypothetical protein
LSGEGFGEFQKRLAMISSDVAKEKVFLDALDWRSCAVKEVAKSLKPFTESLRKMHTDLIALQWRIKKRTKPHKGAVDAIAVFRTAINNCWLFLLQMAQEQKFHDVEKLIVQYKSMSDAGIDCPLRFKVVASHFASLMSCVCVCMCVFVYVSMSW